MSGASAPPSALARERPGADAGAALPMMFAARFAGGRAGAGRRFEHREENALIAFSYTWPARLEARASAAGCARRCWRGWRGARAAAMREARRDRQGARQADDPFNLHSLAL